MSLSLSYSFLISDIFCHYLACRAEPGTPDLSAVLKEIYVLYADCALKDPFYELEMPIRCELFTNAVDALVGTRPR